MMVEPKATLRFFPIQHLMKYFFDARVFNRVPFKIRVRMAHLFRIGKIHIDRRAGIQVFGIMPQPGQLVFTELQPRYHQRIIVLIDRDINSFPMRDSVDPFRMIFIVHIGGQHHHIVEDQSLPLIHRRMHQRFVEIFSHAVQHQVEGLIAGAASVILQIIK